MEKKSAKITLNAPLSEGRVRNLKVGGEVLVSGNILLMRDKVHKRALEQYIPELTNAVIYHCGPIVKKNGKKYSVVAAGPTTSARMNSYMPELLKKYEMRAIIGKGGMDARTLLEMEKRGCVYLSAVGGAASLLASSFRKITPLRFLEEFGSPEALWEAEVENFPAIVTMDSKGNSLHSKVLESSKAVLKRLIG